MKILLPMESNTSIGGGFTFFRNLKKGMARYNLDFTDCITGGGWDACLIVASSVINRATFEQIRAFKKPIILRVDGVPEDWRNRGTGWPRLRDFAKQATHIIYQSEFTKNTVGRLLKRNGKIILNGCDTSIFRSDGEKERPFGDPSILFVNWRDDPNKRTQEAIERFRQFKLDNLQATITFVGQYPKRQFFWDKTTWDFGMLDWKHGEDWQYIGGINDQVRMAKVMRSCNFLAYPSFADPCPNTLIEAINCGCKPLWTCDYGSTPEILDYKKGWSLDRMVKEYYEFIFNILNH